METNTKKDNIDLTLSWLIFAVTLLLGSVLVIPFIQSTVGIQEQSEMFTASIIFIVDSLVFFPPFGCNKWLKYGMIGLNFVILS